MMGHSDPRKDSLVEAVKAYQRSSEDQKQQWWSFCETSDVKKRDPALHSVEDLQSFIDGYGIPVKVQNAKQNLNPGEFQQKNGLIAKIKAYQRSGEEQKQAWWSFCETAEVKKRDPALHSLEDLQSFVQGSGVAVKAPAKQKQWVKSKQ